MATMTYAPPPGPPPGVHTGVQYAPPPGPPPQMYAPPPGPPPQTYPSCRDATDLAAYVRNSLSLLATQGWLSVPLPPDLESLYTTLFAESASFFNLPPDASDKADYGAPKGTNASDEGFSDIKGEKQLITIRRTSRTPPCLRTATAAAWDATGALFLSAMHDIAEGLELPELDAFDAMSAEARGLPNKARAASLMRLFRYNRPESGAGKKVVAEAHKDLGLLTLVVGHSPGLDARDARGRWISVEDPPPGAHSSNGTPRLTATLLAGQTLTYLTRGLYTSGSHRVSVLPTPPTSPTSSPADAFRLSLVFALRPAPAALITTATFAQSPLIGPFPPARLDPKANGGKGNFPLCSMYEQSGTELFKCISQRHWNVNIAPEIRDEQKRKLAEKAGVDPSKVVTVDGVAMAAVTPGGEGGAQGREEVGGGVDEVV
ncbi:hypothetical protein K438DRAFT_1817618 [Mycena galopus ATCC 62051]|nr:hypothetical protein K438DRAFT_1817618 [Mycena galopus ATCC 62051]